MHWISYRMGLWWISVLENCSQGSAWKDLFNHRSLYHRVVDPLEGTLSLHLQLAPLCEALTSREGPKDPPIWQGHGEGFRLGLSFLPGICGGVKHYSKFCCCLLECQYLVMRNVVFQGVCTIFIWDDFYNSLLHLVLDYGIIFLEMFVITWQSIDLGSQPSHCQFIIGR